MRQILFLAFFALWAAVNLAAQDRPLDIPKNMQKYFVVFLVRGAQPQKTDAAAGQALLQQHLAYIRKMIEQKKYVLAGPFLDEGRVAGMLVTSAATEAEARQIAENDPEVKAGALAVEVHAAMLPVLDGVKVQY